MVGAPPVIFRTASATGLRSSYSFPEGSRHRFHELPWRASMRDYKHPASRCSFPAHPRGCEHGRRRPLGTCDRPDTLSLELIDRERRQPDRIRSTRRHRITLVKPPDERRRAPSGSETSLHETPSPVDAGRRYGAPSKPISHALSKLSSVPSAWRRVETTPVEESMNFVSSALRSTVTPRVFRNSSSTRSVSFCEIIRA